MSRENDRELTQDRERREGVRTLVSGVKIRGARNRVKKKNSRRTAGRYGGARRCAEPSRGRRDAVEIGRKEISRPKSEKRGKVGSSISRAEGRKEVPGTREDRRAALAPSSSSFVLRPFLFFLPSVPLLSSSCVSLFFRATQSSDFSCRSPACRGPPRCRRGCRRSTAHRGQSTKFTLLSSGTLLLFFAEVNLPLVSPSRGHNRASTHGVLYHPIR